jgi:DNA-binding transcriptional regulator YiaG
MTHTKRCRSDALRSLPEVAADLHDVGMIDKATRRHFDLSCLTPAEPLEREAIKRIRERSHMNPATFAPGVECEHGSHQEMGARRSAPERAFTQAAHPRRKERDEAIL